MSEMDLFFGPNAGYVLELYQQYRENPESVDAATRALFARWAPEEQAKDAPTTAITQTTNIPTGPAVDITKIVAAARIARLVRELGHLAAHIDPLGNPPPGDPGLELETHGLTTADLEALPATVVGGPLSVGAKNALEALGKLRCAYSGSVGYEDDHVQAAAERDWLREAVETGRFFTDFDAEQKCSVLERLAEVETFERYLDRTYLKKKRFSIEGVDMLVPMLDQIIHDSVMDGTREIVIGMAHRGRLNVLAHILGKPYQAILSEFEHQTHDERPSVSGAGTQGYSGDVKYHLGARRAYRAFTGEGVAQEVPITLAPNPSHLEFVNPVVMGRARAAQEHRDQPGKPHRDIKASLAITIHGDAAFPGQGIVAETLNLSQLSGYRVGGAIRIITNNQIGFTTLPNDARSTLYASDLAKGFEIPIVHVNADDVAACIAVAKMACAYREKFGKDFLIDLVGYRRWGHNEGDEPAFTQPRMYELVRAHPTVRELWAQQLERERLVTRDEAMAMVARVQVVLKKERAAEAAPEATKTPARPADLNGHAATLTTAVPAARLTDLNEMLLQRPEGFTTDAKLERGFQERRRLLKQPQGITWGHAESLALASILTDGTPIRLSGQDTERGTFGHRNLMLHDPTTGDTFCPMQALPAARASFALYNSPLSENACVGFEYGYSIHAKKALVLWEAQFGDFSNGAQVILDQFLVSGQAKWQQTPSLVLLLPHGYEGMGPEHSSARLERYLQLAANGNIRIANCTTAAQFFHLLRRQAALLESEPRPLIVMTPKSLLRHPLASSSLEDLTSGAFHAVLDDPTTKERRDRVTRLVLCTGKIYVDLISQPNYVAPEELAVARVEELYPFPYLQLRTLFEQYANLREVVWMQEEPRNMGAWSYIAPLLRGILPRSVDLDYIGRPESASPAEGVEDQHKAEQARIVQSALSNLPALKPKKNGVTAHVR